MASGYDIAADEMTAAMAIVTVAIAEGARTPSKHLRDAMAAAAPHPDDLDLAKVAVMSAYLTAMFVTALADELHQQPAELWRNFALGMARDITNNRPGATE